MKGAILAKVTEIVERVAARENLEVVEIEVLGGGGNRLIRIYIDKEGGVSHGDCENLSHQVGTIFDVEDVVPGDRYTLEVSSPGLERKLIRPRDFERFAGQKAKLILKEAVNGSKRMDGVLAGLEDGAVKLELEQGGTVSIALDRIDKANLKFEW